MFHLRGQNKYQRNPVVDAQTPIYLFPYLSIMAETISGKGLSHQRHTYPLLLLTMAKQSKEWRRSSRSLLFIAAETLDKINTNEIPR